MKRSQFKVRKWNISIRMRMMIQISMVLLLVIALMVFGIRTLLISKLQNDQIQMQLLKTQSMLDALDNYMMTLMIKTDQLFIDEEFAELIETQPTGMNEIVEKTAALKLMIDTTAYNLRYPEITITNYTGGLVSPCLYIRGSGLYQDEQFIRSLDEIKDEEYIESLLKEKGTFSWNIGRASQTGKHVAFNRRIFSYKTMEDIAILQMQVPVNKILTILRSVENEHLIAFYYLDKDNNLICSQGEYGYLSQVRELAGNTGTVLSLDYQDTEIVANCVDSGLNGYRLISISSMQPIYDALSFLTPIFWLGGTSAVVLGSILLFFLSGSLLKGVRRLVEKAQIASTSADKYEQLEPIWDTTEIEELDAAYARMVRTINQLHSDEAKNQEILTEVQIELLQEQFSPHLLYNTLSLIRYMEEINNQPKIADVLDHLIAFYRQVLNRGQLITRVREEIRMISNYISIVREVYDIDLSAQIDIDENVMDYCTVKMFLQPIVENAIMHGVRQMGSGEISIRGVQEGDMLHFTIIDDGMGMEQQKVRAIQQLMNNADNDAAPGYGYVSVAKRLRLFFGDSYHMKLASELEEGTRVDLYIPALREDQISASLRSRMI